LHITSDPPVPPCLFPKMEDSQTDGPSLIFDLICQSAPEVEHNEIKRVLGASLIEENYDLQNEIDSLSDILSDYLSETGDIQQAKNKSIAFLLPDRERLLGNIKFFVENIQRAATPLLGGRPRSTPQAFIHISTPREQEVVEYVTSELNRTASLDPKSPPEMTRLAGTLRPSSRAQATRPSTAPIQAEPVLAKARVAELGSVKSELRELVLEENRTLKERVENLRLQLEDSIDDRGRVLSDEPPSITEIKDLEGKLEKMSRQMPMTSPLETIAHPHLETQSMAPCEPSSPKERRGNSTSPKKAHAKTTSTSPSSRKVKKMHVTKPLSANTLVLDCSRSSA